MNDSSPLSAEFKYIKSLGKKLREYGFSEVKGEDGKSGYASAIDVMLLKGAEVNAKAINENKQEHEVETRKELPGEQQDKSLSVSDLKQYYATMAKKIEVTTKQAKRDLELYPHLISEEDRERSKEVIKALDETAKLLSERAEMQEQELSKQIEKIRIQEEEVIRQMEEHEEKKEKATGKGNGAIKDALDSLAKIFLPEIYHKDPSKEGAKSLAEEAKGLFKDLKNAGFQIADETSSLNRLVGKQQMHEPFTSIQRPHQGG